MAKTADVRALYGDPPATAWAIPRNVDFDAVRRVRRGGISILGFAAHGLLSHRVPRAYRGGGRSGREADMD
jgi:hypothetical protein